MVKNNIPFIKYVKHYTPCAPFVNIYASIFEYLSKLWKYISFCSPFGAYSCVFYLFSRRSSPRSAQTPFAGRRAELPLRVPARPYCVSYAAAQHMKKPLSLLLPGLFSVLTICYHCYRKIVFEYKVFLWYVTAILCPHFRHVPAGAKQRVGRIWNIVYPP